MDGTIRITLHLRVMGAEDKGGIPFPEYLTQKLHDLLAGPGVQVAGWLVRQHDGRLSDDGAGDADALLLTA